MAADPYKYEHFKQYIPRYTSAFKNEPENENKATTEPTQAKVPLFSKEEARILKAHITSELTKYVNNLKLEGEQIPYFYNHSQAGIGIATQLLYYCAAPFICQILIDDINPGLFIWLMMDPLFRKYWTEGEGGHVLNAGVQRVEEAFPQFRFEEPTLNIFKLFHPKSHISQEEYTRLKQNPGFGHTFTEVFNYRRIELAKEHEQKKKEKLKFVFNAHMRLIYNAFIQRLRQIKEYCITNNFKTAYTTNWHINLLETLRTIFIFYFKGGNSIRAIVDRFNVMERTKELEISNLDKMIPYGSDFDTNLIINPFLPHDTFLKIQDVIEVFIPQFSQFIVLPKYFERNLKTPIDTPNEKGEYIFRGVKPIVREGEKTEYGDDQQQDMRIIMEAYDLNKLYVGRKDKPKLHDKLQELNTKPPFFLDPELDSVQGSISTKKSVRMECDNVLDTTACNISAKSRFTHIFPYDNSQGNPFLPYTANPINDKCLNGLQYSLNLTIPKFRLHRYFLKFSLGEKAKATTSKHRLIKVPDGHFNAEMLDISIVQPFYELDKTKTFYHCELYGLWSDSLDIFKIAIQDKYNLYSHLSSFLPGKFEPVNNVNFTIFINGLNMQINDLAEAVSDTLEDKKYEKLPKRIKRLRLLQYILIVSPSYNSKFTKEELANEILGINKLINLEYPIHTFNEKFPDLLVSEDKKYNVIKRIIDEYYSANFEHVFMKDHLIPKLTIKKSGQSLTVKIFIQQILKKFAEDNLRSIHWDDNFMAISEYMPKLNTLFKNIFMPLFIESIEYSDNATGYIFTDDSETSKSYNEYTLTLKKLKISLVKEKVNKTISYLIRDSNNDYRISPLLFEIVYAIYTHVKTTSSIQDVFNPDIKFLMERIEGIPITSENDIRVNQAIAGAFISTNVEYTSPVPLIPTNQVLVQLLTPNSVEYINYTFKTVYTEFYCNMRKSYIQFVEYYKGIHPELFRQADLRPGLIQVFITTLLQFYSLKIQYAYGSLFNTTTDTFLNFFYFMQGMVSYFSGDISGVEDTINTKIRKFREYKQKQEPTEGYLYELITEILTGIEKNCYIYLYIHTELGVMNYNLFKGPYQSVEQTDMYYTKEVANQILYATINRNNTIKLYTNTGNITSLITSYSGYDYSIYGYNEHTTQNTIFTLISNESKADKQYTISISKYILAYVNIMLHHLHGAHGGKRKIHHTRRKKMKSRSKTGNRRSNKK